MELFANEKKPLTPLPFGTTPEGEPVSLVSLCNGTLSCQILTYGAALRALYVPDRHGAPVDVVLGYDTLEEYIVNDGHFGAIVGRFANRIQGGKFTLNGQTYTLPLNDHNNHLHGGFKGFSRRVWKIEKLAPASVDLSLTSPDGEEGYPGNLTAHVTYALTGSTLSIEYTAQSDADTLCNLTNHSYFNLAGHEAGSMLHQSLTIHAETYTPSDAESIPLGTIEPVAGTPMDFRTPKEIGRDIAADFPQLLQAKGYDHNYVLDNHTPAAEACCRESGITMRMDTTMPGVHLYTGNYIAPGLSGKDGATYTPRQGFCLETQFYPNSPNCPLFPSPLLKKDHPYHHTTTFTFGVE